jgi:hypothetical protein
MVRTKIQKQYSFNYETIHLTSCFSISKGSIRSPETVRNKISRILQTFNKASEKMEGSGRGLTGITHLNYQQHIIDDICRYYFELLPVLKDRPNVIPWYTNHSVDKTVERGRCDSSNESLVDDDDDCIEVNNDVDITVNETSTTNNCAVITQEVSTATCTSTSSSNEILTPRSNRSNQRATSASLPSDKLSPLQAKELQKNIYLSRDRQINSRKKKPKLTLGVGTEEDERSFIVEQRNIKMKFELERHNDLKEQHNDMMHIEKKKLEMQKQEMTIRLDNEKNKKILSKVEIFKARLEFKKADPTISEEFLDLHFPLS